VRLKRKNEKKEGKNRGKRVGKDFKGGGEDFKQGERNVGGVVDELCW